MAGHLYICANVKIPSQATVSESTSYVFRGGTVLHVLKIFSNSSIIEENTRAQVSSQHRQCIFHRSERI